MSFDCVFMKPGGSNFTCSCFTLYHKFRLTPRGDILLVAFPLRIMNCDCRAGRAPFFFWKLVSRSTTRGRSAGFEIMEILGKTTSVNFHEIWYLFQWTRIENETSRFCRFFICFCVPTVAHTTRQRKLQHNCFYCGFMKLGGSNFSCSCFTLNHEFRLCVHETGWQ